MNEIQRLWHTAAAAITKAYAMRKTLRDKRCTHKTYEFNGSTTAAHLMHLLRKKQWKPHGEGKKTLASGQDEATLYGEEIQILHIAHIILTFCMHVFTDLGGTGYLFTQMKIFFVS
ncbi:hypothetical protein ACJX0J_005398, partial [Zea mays]